jgi:hypothetical protein
VQHVVAHLQVNGGELLLYCPSLKRGQMRRPGVENALKIDLMEIEGGGAP